VAALRILKDKIKAVKAIRDKVNKTLAVFDVPAEDKGSTPSATQLKPMLLRHPNRDDIGGMDFKRVVGTFLVWPVVASKHLDITKDVRYATVGEKPRLLDCIRRPGLAAGANVLMYIHGGYYTGGDKTVASMPLLYHFALRMGWLVITINYEKDPMKVKWPSRLHDCLRAVAWARSKDVEKYGGGGRCLAVCGESAGGHLASLVGLTHTVKRMLPPEIQTQELRVDAIVSLYAPSDTHNNNRFLEKVIQIPDVGSEAAQQALNESSSIWWLEEMVQASNASSPPPYMLAHGDIDTICSIRHGRRFAEALEKTRQSYPCTCNVPDLWLELPGQPHSFNYGNNMVSFALTDAVIRFLGAVQTRIGD